MALKLILGLGNPNQGQDYSKTRHNAGFWFLDTLAAQAQVRLSVNSKLNAEIGSTTIAGNKVLIAKPTTFMNRSGLAAQAICSFYRIQAEEVMVAHDELDLSPGTARLKFDGGHGGQNGLRDIMAQFGHGKFHRLRIGIGHPGDKTLVTPWVLGRPNKDDEGKIIDSIGRSLCVLDACVRGDINAAMKTLHTAP
jgi:peptidyl-tRNA hydrolase, PTH1 family